jgi:hypothetical protein
VDVVEVVFVVLVVVVFLAAVVVCVVVTGGVRVVDVVVVVTGATRVTADVVVVTAGAAAASVVVVELWTTGGFLRCLRWWTGRLWGAAAAAEVVLDVLDEVELDEVVAAGVAELLDPLEPPALPHPTIARPAITVNSAAFMRPAPLVAPSLGVKANNA